MATCTVPQQPRRRSRTDNGRRPRSARRQAKGSQNPDSSATSRATGGCPSLTLMGECLLVHIYVKYKVLMRPVNSLPTDRAEMLDHVKKWVFAEKTATSPTASTSPKTAGAASTSSVTSGDSQGTVNSPRESRRMFAGDWLMGAASTATAPGPPAPGPKSTHPQ